MENKDNFRTLTFTVDNESYRIQVSDTGTRLVPIKPICEILGVDYNTQFQKITGDQKYTNYIGSAYTVAADGKEREMFCLTYSRALVWLLGINAAKVTDSAKDGLITIQNACADALDAHFFRDAEKQRRLIAKEMELLAQKEDLLRKIEENREAANALNREKRQVEGQLDNIRQKRIESEDGQMDLFAGTDI